jgi:CheY-like chemotaxis protein
MAGDILVDSTPGRGSTFTAILRLKCAAEGRPQAVVPSSLAHHVLVALDGPVERRGLRLVLEGAGIPIEEGTVDTAGDFISSAAKAGEPFTTLLVDGRAGCPAASALLAKARAAGSVQGIVVLDTAAKANFAEFRAAGFDAYLSRPVRPQSLLTHLGGGVPPAEAADEPKQEAKPELKFGGRSPLVLLVEDNDINALLARRMLERSHCDTRLCSNGREAVDAIRRSVAGLDPPYDLVLMDVHMPVLDGLAATRIIKQLCGGADAEHPGKAPPIVALTANAFEEDRHRCLAAGMDDYLAKPFDKEDLRRLLERWCGAKAGRDKPRAA